MTHTIAAQAGLLLQCREGFEPDVAAEIAAIAATLDASGAPLLPAAYTKAVPRAGFATTVFPDGPGRFPSLSRSLSRALDERIFIRQIWLQLGTVKGLPEESKAQPLAEAVASLLAGAGLEGAVEGVTFEAPDTNDGKELFAFCRSFGPHFERALAKLLPHAVPKVASKAKRASTPTAPVDRWAAPAQAAPYDASAPSNAPAPAALSETPDPAAASEASDTSTPAHVPRKSDVRIFFTSWTECVVGVSFPRHTSPFPMGVPRLKFPARAPSRSTLKLEEAFLTLLTETERESALRPGLSAVDLGAAPGGWTYQFVQRSMHVTAIDNGAIDPELLASGFVEHRKEDGFRFRPRKPVEWMVCDMVEQPSRVARLAADWLRERAARRAIFNLKLPMKSRYAEVARSLEGIRADLAEAGLEAVIRCRHLYHDREEVTCYVGPA